MLRLTREHGGIENRVCHVRDVAWGENPCRIRTGAAPRILSTLRNVTLNLLRNVTLTLLRWNHMPNIAAALRRDAAYPLQALARVRPDG